MGAIIFPVGFVMLVLLGLELATGNFALLPMAWMEGRIGMAAMLRNWSWVYGGNLIGSCLYAVLFWVAITSFGSSTAALWAIWSAKPRSKRRWRMRRWARRGWGTAFVRAVLCNWMVTVGTLLAFASRSTAGKVLGMWLPITTFFAHGYEHSVVNMFVIPAGMLLKAPVSTGQWWIWNQIPVTLGNILAGAMFTGVALWWTHARKQQQPSPEADAAIAVVTAKVRVGYVALLSYFPQCLRTCSIAMRMQTGIPCAHLRLPVGADSEHILNKSGRTL